MLVMVVSSLQSDTQETKAGGLPQVRGLPGLQNKYKTSQNHIARSCPQNVYIYKVYEGL